MATILEQEEEEQKDQEEQVPQIAGGIAGAPGAAAAAPPAARRPTGAGRATNLQRYIQANIGAGQELAGGLRSDIEQRAEQARAGIGETRTRFEQAASPLKRELGEEGQQAIETAFKDPQQLLQQQQQLEQFQRLRDVGAQQQIGQLGVGTQELQRQQQGVARSVEQAGTEAGRFQLLQGAFGQPSYSRGQRRLDQLLLQAAPGATRGLQGQLRGTAQQLGQEVSGLGEELGARQQALQNLAQQRSQDIQQLFAGGREEGLEAELGQRGFQDIEQDVQARLAQMEQQAPEIAESLRTGLGRGALSQEQLGELGLESGMQLWDIDPSTFISQAERVPTIGGIASPEDVARYQALQQLSGTQGNLFGGMASEEAGTFRPYDFDLPGLQEAAAGRQQQFEELRDITGELAGTIAQPFTGQPRFMGTGYAGKPQQEIALAAQALGQDFSVDQLQRLIDAYQQGISSGALGVADRPGEISSRAALQQLMGALPPSYTGLDPSRVLQVDPGDVENPTAVTF